MRIGHDQNIQEDLQKPKIEPYQRFLGLFRREFELKGFGKKNNRNAPSLAEGSNGTGRGFGMGLGRSSGANSSSFIATRYTCEMQCVLYLRDTVCVCVCVCVCV